MNTKQSQQIIFTGYASTSHVDRQGDLIDNAAFKLTKNVVVLLWQHKQDMPIGYAELAVDTYGLKIKGVMLSHLPHVDNIKNYLQEPKIGLALSIGYIAKQSKQIFLDGCSVRNITKLEILEVSIVTVPANSNAVIEHVYT